MSEWKTVTTLGEIPILGSRVIETDSIRIALFRTSQDQVFALRDECPHKKGPLSQGIVHGTAVTCPLHNWNIDLATGEAMGADEGCTHSFACKVEGDSVMLAFPLEPAATAA